MSDEKVEEHEGTVSPDQDQGQEEISRSRETFQESGKESDKGDDPSFVEKSDPPPNDHPQEGSHDTPPERKTREIPSEDLHPGSPGRGGEDHRSSERVPREHHREGASAGGGRPPRERGHFRKKVCRLCVNKIEVAYKDPDGLRKFITTNGKILPRRISGLCAKHQRVVAVEIKRARFIALLPYAVR